MTIARPYEDFLAMQTCPLVPQSNEKEVLKKIQKLKTELGEQVLILGHHYQREEVFAFADISGDSLKLSQQAADSTSPYIIFCGVHFMAETADILTTDAQTVILPDLAAGCSMADMANDEQVNEVWAELASVIDVEASVTPVTYINSTAALKSFCGQHGGIVCTSSNAQKTLEWSWAQRDKILFFPDQHLGRNTALAMGMSDELMIVWDPLLPLGGNSLESIQKAKLILWKGYCSVHMLFQAEHVHDMREEYTDIQILAHPECDRSVCDIADFVGSTEAIIAHVAAAKTGQRFAIGTELNLVNRLRLQFPQKPVHFLSPTICMCSTMFRTDPQHLLAALQSIADHHITNQVKVHETDKHWAKISLQRMLAI
ncbi:MAG: quinolinate synthase NadA [Mariprofundaceae bacterium]|nr:quinolinate synthase NadA [Mariprofundaceae bacterium]